MRTPWVAGRIHLDRTVPAFAGATAYVRLLDVSAADAPAVTVAEQTIADVGHAPGEEAFLPFALYLPGTEGAAPERGPRDRYVARVWIDLDGDGELGRGDLTSVQSYPAHPDRQNLLTITVKEVK